MTQPVSPPPPPRPDPNQTPVRKDPAGQAPFGEQLQRALAGEPGDTLPAAGPPELQLLRSFQDVRFIAGAVPAPAPTAEDVMLSSVPAETGTGPAQRESPAALPGGGAAAAPAAGAARITASMTAGERLQPAPQAALTGRVLPPARSAPLAGASVQPAGSPPPDGRLSSDAPGALRLPVPAGRAPAGIQGHFVSLVQGEGGVEVRVRARGADEDERHRIEAEVASWLAGHGIRIASLRIEGAGNRPEGSREDGTWTR